MRASRVLKLSLLFLALALPAPRARAQANSNPPERMTYQGFLVDGNGVALATNAPKNYDIVFRIWKSPTLSGNANRLWSEFQTVTVDKGYFSVVLGEGSQYQSEGHGNLSAVFNASDASERYIEITVKNLLNGTTDVTLLPRLRLLAAPFAFLAKTAITASTAAGLASGTNASVLSLSGSNVTFSGVVTAAAFSGDGTGLTGLWSKAGSELYYNGGNVGIGTNDPSRKLELFGTGSVDFGIGSSDGHKWGLRSVGSGASSAAGTLNIVDYSAGNLVRLTLDPAGLVGIGTTSPDEKLHVAGKVKANSFVGDGSALTGIHSLDADDGNPTNVVYVNSSGNVGIGTAAPTEKLQVVGNAAVSGSLNVTGALTLGTTGETLVSAPAAFRLIRGRVDSNGTKSLGSGFTSSVTTTAGIPSTVFTYTVTFDPPFADVPSVTATVEGDNQNVWVESVSASKVVFKIGDTHRAARFHFIAAGGR